MAEQGLLKPEPNSKWIAGISPGQPVCEVGGRVLGVRLKAVCHALSLAGQKSGEDIEHVHQLRVSVRRAVEAVRVFSALIAEAELGPLRDRLRRIRLAADEARNWDVTAQRFIHREGVAAEILDQVKARRRGVQEPINAVCQELDADACEAKIEQLAEQVRSRPQGDGKRRFGRQAPQHLASVVKKFFRAGESELSTDEALHALRIRAKKLRYSMEIVAVAFDSAFREKLYPHVTLLQDLLGTVNDHATATKLLGELLSEFEDVKQRAFLEGLLVAEQRATEDLRAAFLATWTSKAVSGLKRQFRAYC